MGCVTFPPSRSRKSPPLIGGAGNFGKTGGPENPVSGSFGKFRERDEWIGKETA